MVIPISKRLRCCADMVPHGARVADIGTDHGYLGIWLLRQGAAAFVTAADLREKPLQKARENAEKFQVSDRMDFVLSDGLQKIAPDAADTVVCAGMGGDCITAILAACPWLRDPRYTLILQPQSGGQDLRRWLGENGFCMEREVPVSDGGFLYTVALVRYDGVIRMLSPGEQYVSKQLLESGSELVGTYLGRIENALCGTVESLTRSAVPQTEKLGYFRQALEEVRERMKDYVNC